MKRRIHFLILHVIFSTFLLDGCILYRQEVVFIEDVKLPPEWHIQKSVKASEVHKTIIWEVGLSVAPIHQGDYMAFNDFCLLLINCDNFL